MATNDRVQAPGKAHTHPDYFFSLSGGIDSVAALITARDALETRQAGGNFIKKPVAIYLDTRTGVPLNRLYCEQVCDHFDLQLWTLRTDEKFEQWLASEGAPGSGAHTEVRNELKHRQISKLTTLADNPTMILGIAADESDTRAEFDKVREMDTHTEVFPVHRMSRERRAEIILRSDAPRNPLWQIPEAIKDCGCLANGDPSELKRTAELFPEYGQRLREWEEAIEYDGLKGTLGWSGLTAEEQRAREQGQTQSTLPMCSDGCGRSRVPNVVKAFRADAHGADVEQSVQILYGEATLDAVA